MTRGATGLSFGRFSVAAVALGGSRTARISHSRGWRREVDLCFSNLAVMNYPPTFGRVPAVMVLLIFATSVAARAGPVKPPAIRRVWVGPDPSDIDDDWAVSSDGRFVVYRDATFKLALHDLHTGRTRHVPIEVSPQQGHVGFA
jgi:hypothetical protein